MENISKEEYQELYQNFSVDEMGVFLDRVLEVKKRENVTAEEAGWLVAREMLIENSLCELMHQNKERIFEIQQKASRLVLNTSHENGAFHIARDIFLAGLDGCLTPKSLETKYMDTDTARLCLEASDLVRENFYLYYKYADSKTLENKLRAVIKMYSDLKDIGLENLEIFDRKNCWHETHKILSQIIREEYDKGKGERLVGAGLPDLRPKDLKDKKMYLPSAFDTMYYIISNVLNPKDENQVLSRSIFQEALSMVEGHINLLKRDYLYGDIEGFRSVIIEDIAIFKDEEINRIEEHIREFLENEKEKHR